MPCYSYINERWFNHSKDVAERLLRDERLRIAAKRTSIILKSEGLDIDYSLLKEATVIGGALHDIGKTLTMYQKGDLIHFTSHDQAGAAILMYFLIEDQVFGSPLSKLTSNEPIMKGHIVENSLDTLIITTFSAVLMHHYAYRGEYLELRREIIGHHEHEIAPECLDDISAILDWLMEVITNDVSRQLVQRLRNNLVGKILIIDIDYDKKRRVETLYGRINRRPVVMDAISNAISTYIEVAIASVNIADSNSAKESRRGA